MNCFVKLFPSIEPSSKYCGHSETISGAFIFGINPHLVKLPTCRSSWCPQLSYKSQASWLQTVVKVSTLNQFNRSAVFATADSFDKIFVKKFKPLQLMIGKWRPNSNLCSRKLEAASSCWLAGPIWDVFYSFCWDPGHCWLVPIATFFLQLTSSVSVLGFLRINACVGIKAKNDIKSHFSRIFDHKMLSSLHWHRIISPPCASAIFPDPFFLFQRPLLISQLAGLRDTTAGLPRVKWGFLPRTPFPCPC